MDKAKLRSVMALKSETSAVIAEAIGITPQTFSAKINEKNGAEFTQTEIAKIKERYELTAEEVQAIFFN